MYAVHFSSHIGLLFSFVKVGEHLNSETQKHTTQKSRVEQDFFHYYSIQNTPSLQKEP